MIGSDTLKFWYKIAKTTEHSEVATNGNHITF